MLHYPVEIKCSRHPDTFLFLRSCCVCAGRFAERLRHIEHMEVRSRYQVETELVAEFGRCGAGYCKRQRSFCRDGLDASIASCQSRQHLQRSRAFSRDYDVISVVLSYLFLSEPIRVGQAGHFFLRRTPQTERSVIILNSNDKMRKGYSPSVSTPTVIIHFSRIEKRQNAVLNVFGISIRLYYSENLPYSVFCSCNFWRLMAVTLPYTACNCVITR